MGLNRTNAAGSYPAGASPYGTLDMAGNVWERVGDWYDAEYYKKSPTENPQGPETGDYHVVRGGSYYNDSSDVRSSRRGYWSKDDYRYVGVGFRAFDELSRVVVRVVSHGS